MIPVPYYFFRCPACKQKELLRFLPRKVLRLDSFCDESQKQVKLVYQRTLRDKTRVSET